MNVIICPRCEKIGTLIDMGDGNYKCINCQYIGDLSGKELIKKMK